MSQRAPSDETIKRVIVDELFWDSRVDTSKILVEVTNREATLTGRVPTAADRMRAEADAREARGLVTVHNQLQIDTTLPIPDQELCDNVVDTLTWSPEVDTEHFHTTVKNGTVTLQGSVPSYWQKLRARRLAAGVTGVEHVTDELAVVLHNRPKDHEIAARLEQLLDERFHGQAETIQVIVIDGAVTLRGAVNSQDVAQRIQRMTERTQGINAVRNMLDTAHATQSP